MAARVITAGLQDIASALSRIAQLDQRTALPDQCLHSAEADVRPPRRKSGFDPKPDVAKRIDWVGQIKK